MLHFKDLFDRLIDYSRSLEWEKGLKFIISILTLYTLFWFGLQVTGLESLKNLTTAVSSALLNFVGIANTVSYGSIPVIFVAGETGVKAAVTDLCVGDIELALLPAIILSTFDRSLRKRLIGSVTGLAFILILNPLRIFTVIWAGSAFGWKVAEFLHSFTFRAMLILIILGFYYTWYLKYGSIQKRLNQYGVKAKEKIQR